MPIVLDCGARPARQVGLARCDVREIATCYRGGCSTGWTTMMMMMMMMMMMRYSCLCR